MDPDTNNPDLNQAPQTTPAPDVPAGEQPLAAPQSEQLPADNPMAGATPTPVESATPAVPALDSATPDTGVQPQTVISPDNVPIAPVASSDFSASPASGAGGSGQSFASAPPPKNRSFKKFIIALVVIIVIAGGAAFAYFGVVAPNRPANVLRTAFLNSLQQEQTSTNGTITASGSGPAYKVSFSSAENTAAKAVDFKLNLTVSGVTFPVEARLINQNLYLKVGDLSSIASLVNAYDPSAGSMVQSLSSDLSNKWIVADSTLLDESSGIKCALNTNWALTSSDIKLLENQYDKHPFAAIKSTSSSTVGGKSAEKFVLNISNTSLNNFGNGAKNVSLLKNLEKCLGNTSTSTSSASHGHTPLTVWVDKSSKRIVQIANSSGNQKSGTAVSTTIMLHYGKVSITAPKNAEPAVQFLSSLESALGGSSTGLSQLLGSGNTGSSNSSTSSQANDAKRKTDLMALQTQLEAYWAQNGYYPSLTDMNSASWRQANMPSLDSAALQDPSGTGLALAAKPAANIYAYQVTNAQGASCESKDTQCAKYTLTATLSSGKTYTRSSLN